jgi:hypothetical protein
MIWRIEVMMRVGEQRDEERDEEGARIADCCVKQGQIEIEIEMGHECTSFLLPMGVFGVFVASPFHQALLTFYNLPKVPLPALALSGIVLC